MVSEEKPIRYARVCQGLQTKIPKCPVPEQFNFTKPEEWPDWKQRFSGQQVTTKLSKDPEEVQLSALTCSKGPEVKQVNKSFTLEDDEGSKDYEHVLGLFDGHFLLKPFSSRHDFSDPRGRWACRTVYWKPVRTRSSLWHHSSQEVLGSRPLHSVLLWVFPPHAHLTGTNSAICLYFLSAFKL